MKQLFLEAVRLITHDSGIVSCGLQNDPRYRLDPKLDPTRENLKILLPVARGLLDRQNANGESSWGGAERQPSHPWCHRLEILVKALESAEPEAWVDARQQEDARHAAAVRAIEDDKIAKAKAVQDIVDQARQRELTEDAKLKAGARKGA